MQINHCKRRHQEMGERGVGIGMNCCCCWSLRTASSRHGQELLQLQQSSASSTSAIKRLVFVAQSRANSFRNSYHHFFMETNKFLGNLLSYSFNLEAEGHILLLICSGMTTPLMSGFLNFCQKSPINNWVGTQFCVYYYYYYWRKLLKKIDPLFSEIRF